MPVLSRIPDLRPVRMLSRKEKKHEISNVIDPIIACMIRASSVGWKARALKLEKLLFCCLENWKTSNVGKSFQHEVQGWRIVENVRRQLKRALRPTGKSINKCWALDELSLSLACCWKRFINFREKQKSSLRRGKQHIYSWPRWSFSFESCHTFFWVDISTGHFRLAPRGLKMKAARKLEDVQCTIMRRTCCPCESEFHLNLGTFALFTLLGRKLESVKNSKIVKVFHLSRAVSVRRYSNVERIHHGKKNCCDFCQHKPQRESLFSVHCCCQSKNLIT